MKKKVLAITLAAMLVLTLGLVMAGPVGAGPAPSIVSLWHFDTGIGSTAYDSEGSNDGTLNGDPTWTDISGTMPGFGYALDFDPAVTSDYVSVPDDSSLDITGAITVEAWVYVDSMAGNNFYTVAGKWNDVGVNNRAYLLGLSTKDTANPQPKFYISWNGTNFASAASPTTLSLDTWYHLMGTYDGQVIKIYVDCVEEDSTDLGSATAITTNDEPLLIGGDRAGQPANLYFDGMIDEVRIWNTDFPDPEVTASPSTDANPLGSDHTVTATVDPVAPGYPINFDVTAGPNSGDNGSDTTDANGEATFTYTGDSVTGTDDTIRASIDMDCSGAYDSGEPYDEVTKTWVTLDDLTPDVAYNPVGGEHCVTATVYPAVAGAEVFFRVIGANTQPRTSVITGSDGKAEYCYDGTHAGEDTIKAWLEVNGTPGCQKAVDIWKEVTKYWLQHYVTGGGNINTGKGKNVFKITFGGNVGLIEDYGDPVGQYQINFHHVSVGDIDKGNFHSTAITYLEFVDYSMLPDPSPPEADYNYVRFDATGKFNGEDGWKLRVNATDYGEGNKTEPDEIRIRLWEPSLSTSGPATYDTYVSTDFPDESYHSRTDLDGGNIQIHPPEIPTP